MPDKPSELKLCPFCGHDARMFASDLVGCRNDDCWLSRYLTQPEKWNRRTPDRDALVEVARRALLSCYTDESQRAFIETRAARIVTEYLAEQAEEG